MELGGKELGEIRKNFLDKVERILLKKKDDVLV